MEYKVITDYFIKRQSKFDGKNEIPLNLFDVYFGKDGDTISNPPTPIVSVLFNNITHFVHWRGVFKLSDLPEIENVYNDNDLLFHVKDKGLIDKILSKIIL